MKVHGKFLWVAIKQDSSLYINPHDYAIKGVLENKTNAPAHLIIGSLKTAIEEWDKRSEEFFLKACKSFRRCVYTIIKKDDGHIG